MRPRSAEANVLSKTEFYKIRRDTICKFANMGLRGREISYAIEVETKGQIRVNPRTVRTVVFQRREGKQIRKLTPEEKAEIAKTVANPWDYTDEVMREDILSILQNIKRLEEEGKPLPQNRLELRKFRILRSDGPTNKKEGGIRTGNKTVYLDGTHIPTFAGMKHKSARNEKNAQIHRGKQEPKESVRRQSKVYEFIGPLCLRLPQMSPSEWANITQFTLRPLKRTQVIRSIHLKGRPEWHSLPKEFYSQENIRERSKRGRKFALDRKKLRERKLSSTEERQMREEVKNRKLVAHFLNQGFFSWDLSLFNEVKEMLSKNGKSLPQNPLDLLRLEIYAAAIRGKGKTGGGLLKDYIEVGNKISIKWFARSDKGIKADIDWVKDEKQSAELVEGLLENGLMDSESDPADLKILDKFFENRGESASYRQICEVFMRIKRRSIETGNLSELNKYGELGEKVDPQWFVSEKLIQDRQAIMGFLPKATTHSTRLSLLDGMSYEEGEDFIRDRSGRE